MIRIATFGHRGSVEMMFHPRLQQAKAVAYRLSCYREPSVFYRLGPIDVDLEFFNIYEGRPNKDHLLVGIRLRAFGPRSDSDISEAQYFRAYQKAEESLLRKLRNDLPHMKIMPALDDGGAPLTRLNEQEPIILLIEDNSFFTTVFGISPGWAPLAADLS